MGWKFEKKEKKVSETRQAQENSLNRSECDAVICSQMQNSKCKLTGSGEIVTGREGEESKCDHDERRI